jgi:arginyl-tRNA synthetase
MESPEKSLSLDGDSGPYLQYALVRARSILEKHQLAVSAGTVEASEEMDAEIEKHAEHEQKKEFEIPLLARHIVRFPEIVLKAQTNSAPHVISQYLTQLASAWNSFYAQGKIIGADDESEKILITRAFEKTMEQGLWLLGISSPEKM